MPRIVFFNLDQEPLRHARRGVGIILLHHGHGAPAAPQGQASDPLHGLRGWASQPMSLLGLGRASNGYLQQEDGPRAGGHWSRRRQTCTPRRRIDPPSTISTVKNVNGSAVYITITRSSIPPAVLVDLGLEAFRHALYLVSDIASPAWRTGSAAAAGAGVPSHGREMWASHTQPVPSQRGHRMLRPTSMTAADRGLRSVRRGLGCWTARLEAADRNACEAPWRYLRRRRGTSPRRN
jgi:hypothetical protein